MQANSEQLQALPSTPIMPILSFPLLLQRALMANFTLFASGSSHLSIIYSPARLINAVIYYSVNSKVETRKLKANKKAEMLKTFYHPSHVHHHIVIMQGLYKNPGEKFSCLVDHQKR